MRDLILKRIQRPLRSEQIAVAALCAVPFFLAVLALHFAMPAGPIERLHGDPLLVPLRNLLGEYAVPILAAATLAAWLVRYRPGRTEISEGLREAAIGAALSLVATLALRYFAGPDLPSFIPPEESARPGMLLGLSAGLVEEVLFRLGTLPLLYFALRKPLGENRAKLLAVVATGLLFALSHELAETAFQPQLFVTRTLLPGCLMSALCFALSPAGVVALHCTAHLAIPFLFR